MTDCPYCAPSECHWPFSHSEMVKAEAVVKERDELREKLHAAVKKGITTEIRYINLAKERDAALAEAARLKDELANMTARWLGAEKEACLRRDAALTETPAAKDV